MLKNYVHQTSDPSAVHQPEDSDERNYDLEIRWTPDTDIQERLRMLQCEAIFHQTNNYVCKTSVVNINFVQGEPEGTFLGVLDPDLWNAIMNGCILLSGGGNFCVRREICMKDVEN